ncbi:hypothetical protein ES288_A04G159800v1 [Gossypium darwinii]|uniref:PUM-HD domain-containing protein n=1 Tax=Gossypium darwinii TaxID=34276 RepID=A0A5D2GY08_GOSDA|nr:hypothetical protein ES288_A04G159800v1 [Gossypium darwinii]
MERNSYTQGLQIAFMGDPTEENQEFPFNDSSSAGFSNPNFSQGLQSHHDVRVFGFQQSSLDDRFSQLNLNDIENPTRIVGSDFGPAPIGLFPENSFNGRHVLRSLPSQNMVVDRSPNYSPSTFIEHNVFDFDTNTQRRTPPSERPYNLCDPMRSVNGLGSTMMRLSMHDHHHQPLHSPPPRQLPRENSSYYYIPPLTELKAGDICTVAKDRDRCLAFQKKLDNEVLTRGEIDMIFMEVKDHLHELMVHRFANYLIQKLFKAINNEQRTQLLLLLIRSHQRFFQVCTNLYGSRTIQKFIEIINIQEQKCILLSALKPIAITLAKDSNGHHIFEPCLKKFSSEETMHLMDGIIQHCVDIAINKSGCCALQQCLTHANDEVSGHFLVRIVANALFLSEDKYGNYVVQFVLQMGLPWVTSMIIGQLQGSFVSLCYSKYGSNVVEKCMKESEEQLSARVIIEILNDPDYLKVFGHDYGNFVIQSALWASKGHANLGIHNAIHCLIRKHYSFLQSSPFGRRILSAASKCRRST